MSAELPATVPTSFLQSLSYLIVGIDRHSNVASVLHLGRTGTGYFYAMSAGGSKSRRTKIISAVGKTASVSKSGANAILAQIILDIPTS